MRLPLPPAPSHWFRLLGVLLLCAVTTAPAAAQSSGDGSFYSRYGIGMLESFSSPQSEAMGQGAFALRTTNYNPTANPALWADQVFTRATGSVRINVINAEGPDGTSAQLGAGSLEALQISFPIYTSRLGVGLALQPYSTSNYEVFRSGRVDIGVNDPINTTYETAYEGRGGLYLFRSGLGGRLTDNIRLGASVDVIFGSTKSSTRTRFPNISPTTLNPSISTLQTRVSGVTSTVGSQFSFFDVFQENDIVGIGLTMTLPATLTGDRTRTLGESADSDTVATVDGEMDLPYEIKGGIAYHMGERWKFVADGLYAPWSTFEARFPTTERSLGRFPVGGEETLNDRWRLSAGSEFVPAGDDRFGSYFARTRYRLGTYVEQQYTTSDPGTNVYVMGATGGLSLPTAVAGTRVDLTFHVGTRGAGSSNVVQDTFYGGSLAISIGERWFQDPKLR